MLSVVKMLLKGEVGGCALNSHGNYIVSVRVYAVIISKYATKIVGTKNRQVPCVHGTQDQKQSTFNIFNPAQ